MNTTCHTIYLRSASFITLILLGFPLLFSSVWAEAQAKDPNITVDNGDLLYVIIPREVTSEFNPTEKNYFKEKVEVDRHGYIFLPSQGNIKISGYTTKQISETLTNNLPKYLSKSDKASVNLIEKRHYIQILGHVATPGWYNISESANIQSILSQAGGVLDGADLARVTIVREENNKQKKIPADIQQYLLRGDTTVLPRLHENDTVFVPLLFVREGKNTTQVMGDAIKIRIFGAVNSPGIYPVPKGEGINLLDLIIAAEGEAHEADMTKIKIIRANGARKIFNMQALLDNATSSKTASFPMIYGGDIVHIGRIAVTSNGEQPIPVQETITMTGPGSNSHGLRPFSAPMTPLEAISQGGGMNPFAEADDIFIIRRVDGKQKNIPYNYDKALKGEEPDVDFQLEAGDIIFIP